MNPRKAARLRKLPGIAVLIAAGAIALFGLRVRVDNRIELWIQPDAQQKTEYADFKHMFGSDEFIVVAYTGQPLFTENSLRAQSETLGKLEGVPGVHRVEAIPKIYRDVYGSEDPQALKEEFLTTPFYQGFLISEDGETAGLLVEVRPPDSAAGRIELTKAIHAAADPLAQHGFKVHFAGPPELNAILDLTSSGESARTFPPAFVLSIAVLALLFRSVRATAVAVACAALTVAVTMGYMGLAGRPLTMVSAVLPSLLWVLSLANAIHLLRRFQVHRQHSESLEQAILAARREVLRPCILASVTTGAGFLSLMTAEMAPVRQVGAFAAAGILSSLPINLLVGPLLVSWLRVPPLKGRPVTPETVSSRFASRLNRYKLPVLAGAVAVALVFLSLLPAIRVESDPLSFLPRDSSTVKDYAFVSQHLTGFYSLELVIDTEKHWLDSATWPALEHVRTELEAMPGVAHVLSPLSVLKKMNQWDHDFEPAQYMLPEDSHAARTLVEEAGEGGAEVLQPLVSSDGRTVRLSALIRVMDSSDFEAIVSRSEELLRALPQPMEGYCTGIVLQLVDSQTRLVHSQLTSLVLAFFVIFGVIAVGLRSLRLALLSIPPNIFPLLAAFALMAVTRTPLDAATVMVAGVALGIAVDDTVHLLSNYRRARTRNDTVPGAVQVALAETGPAMFITTVTACIGFFALARSDFLPIAWFGVLSGLAMAIALISDLLVTPAMLLIGQRNHE